MAKDHKEWLLQADYDMDSADYMLKGGRRVYGIFLCHLSIEKALRGLYQFTLQEIPPKTHSLMFLLEKLGTVPPPTLLKFISVINGAHVVTSYPEDFLKFHQAYSKRDVERMLRTGRKTLAWIKTQFSE